MPNRNSRRPDREERKPQGTTRPAQGPTQQPQPRMPHERDESTDAQAANEPSQRRMGRLAHDDVERGVVDTTRESAIEETYERLRDSGSDPDR